MDRRRFLLNAGSVLAVSVIAPEQSPEDLHAPRVVGEDEVREIRASIDRLYLDDQSVGGGALWQQAIRLYHDVRRMLDQAEYGEHIGRDLTTLVSELAVCVGWLSFDAGHHRQARMLYEEGFLLADQARNPALALRAVEKMTLQSVHVADHGHLRGAGREALRLAGRLTELGRYEDSSHVHALIGIRQAIAHAVTGDRDGFRAAITRAWREVDRPVDQSAEPSAWLRFVSPAEIGVQEAKGYRYLGEPATAVRLYRASLNEAELPPRNHANYQAQFAATLLVVGDLSGALSEAREVISTLHGRVVSPRTISELTRVRDAAGSCGDEEFCSLFDQLSRAA